MGVINVPLTVHKDDTDNLCSMRPPQFHYATDSGVARNLLQRVRKGRSFWFRAPISKGENVNSK